MSGESGDVREEGEDATTVQELLKDPEAVSALSQKIAQFIKDRQQSPLPEEVQRRVNALKNLQVEFLKIESEFYKEVQLLEVKYMKQYQPLLDKRKEVVTGSYEPTDEECQWADDEPSEDKGKKDGEASSSPATGVPGFWLTALKNAAVAADWVKEHDEAALQHLTDIKVVYTSPSGMDFVLKFFFSENDWFSNSCLTKSYKMACEVDEDDPFSFEGAAITSCEGCKIDWKKSKNLTIKTVKKKQKHKGAGGHARVVTKTVPNESFFSFFSPPKLEEEEDEEVSQLLSDDYARAEFIRDRLVPKAVLFFTGEIMDFEDDDYDMEEGEEEEDEEEENGEGDQAAKPECKQQ